MRRDAVRNVCMIWQPYDLPSVLMHPVTPTVQEQVPVDSVLLGSGTCGLLAWLQLLQSGVQPWVCSHATG